MSEFPFLAESDGKTTAGWWQQLTLADGMLLVISVLAAVIRLTNLGNLPLSPAEAEAALGVWHLWQAGDAAIFVASPTYFGLTALLTQLFGYSDAIMRLIPALFGVGLVLLPRLLRQRLGPAGMLVTSLLLAVSPLATITARTSGGDAIALFALLLLVVAWVRYVDGAAAPARVGGEAPWRYVMAGAVALGLTSSPLFYGGLATLLLAWRLDLVLPPALLPAHQNLRLSSSEWRKAAVFGVVLFLGLASLFLWYLPGVGSAAALLGDWLGSLGFAGGPAALFSPLLALIRYELILLPLGLFAVVWSGWQEERLPKFCALWLGAVAVLLALQWGQIANASLALLPGYLLLGALANAVLTDLGDRLSWLFAAGLTVVGAVIFVNVARFSRAIAFDATDQNNVWLALFALLFTLVTLYFLWTWDFQATNQGVLLAALALFAFYHWGTAWWLGHLAANDVRERWVQAPATDSDVYLLQEIVHQVARQAHGDPSGLDLFSAVDSPVLRWYLRDFPRLQVGQAAPASAQNDLIITDNQEDPLPGSDYFGNDFGLLHTGIQPETWRGPTPIVDTLRWWLFHESGAVTTNERVVLWIRADLTQP